MQCAQPGAAAVWRATAGCGDATLPKSGRACATVLAFRPRWNGEAPRTLDADLRHAETQLSRFPAVVTAVPQAEIAAQVINWVAFRLIKLTVDDIHLARTAGMALMPQIAGLVLMLATTCSNPSDRRALARSSIRQARHMARTKISGASICTDHAIDLQRRRFTIAVRVIDKVVA